jgi:hypothetical protein
MQETPPEVSLFLGSLALALLGCGAWLVLKLLQRTERRYKSRISHGSTRRSSAALRPAQGFLGPDLSALPERERALASLAQETIDDLRRTQQELDRIKASGALPTTTPEAMTVHEWLTLTAQEADRAPHLFLIGATGSGKTTAAMAQFAARKGKKLIIDPKPPLPGRVKWGGLPYVMIGADGGYNDIRAALKVANDEYRRRLAGLRNGTVHGEFEELTIFVDEAPTVVSECPDVAPKLFKDIGRIGRELRIRLVLMSQTDRVKALGLEGEGDTRENFVFITLKLAGTKHNPVYLASMEWLGEQYELETRGLAEIGNRPVSDLVLWRHPGINLVKPGEPTSSELLSGFLDDGSGGTGSSGGADRGTQPVTSGSQVGSNKVTEAHEPEPKRTAPESEVTSSRELFTATEIAKIAKMIHAGEGRTRTVKAMPRYSGSRYPEYAAFYDMLYSSLQEQGK